MVNVRSKGGGASSSLFSGGRQASALRFCMEAKPSTFKVAHQGTRGGSANRVVSGLQARHQQALRLSSQVQGGVEGEAVLQPDSAALSRHWGSGNPASGHSRRPLAHLLSGSKEGHRQGQGLHRSSQGEPTHRLQALQDGGPSHCFSAGQERRLWGDSRHEGLLHALAPKEARPPSHEVHVGGSQVSMLGNAIRSGSCSSTGNKAVPAGSSQTSIHGSSSNRVYRRLLTSVSFLQRGSATGSAYGRSDSPARLRHPSRQVSVGAKPVQGLLGHSGQHKADAVQGTKRKAQVHSQGDLCPPAPKRVRWADNQATGLYAGEAQCSPGRSGLSSASPVASPPPSQAVTGRLFLGGQGSPRRLFDRGVAVVAAANAPVERPNHYPQALSDGADDRCQSPGLGWLVEEVRSEGSLSRRSKRLLAGKGGKHEQQWQGTQGCPSLSQSCHQSLSRPHRSSRDRQQGHHGLYQPHGGQVKVSALHGKGALAPLPPTLNPATGSPQTWQGESQGRQALQVDSRPHRCATSSFSFSEGRTALGSSHCGSVCQQAQSSSAQVCLLETRSRGNSSGCIHVPAQRRKSLLLSSSRLHSQTSPGSGASAGHCDSHRSRLAGSMAPRPSALTAGSSSPSQGAARASSPGSSLEIPPLESSLLQDLGIAFQAGPFPQGYADSALKTQKLHTYSTHWKAYKKWCSDTGRHPFISSQFSQVTEAAALSQLMAFLDFVKPSMKSHGYFANHKSAVCSAFRLLYGFELGLHPLIKNWMFGWAKEMPAQPRHDPGVEPWDVGLIVQYWSTQPANSDLDTATLGLKALSLFAISVYPRVSDLAKLSRDSLRVHATHLRYRFFGTKELSAPKFTATQGLSRAQATLVCPVSALHDYVQRTSGAQFLHRDRSGSFDQVFMAMKPVPKSSVFKPVGAQTCSRWMKQVMHSAGVSTHWTGGSIRMAGSSKALDEGEPIDAVMSIGRWTSWSVFKKFYDRSRIQPAVGVTQLAA